MPRAQIGPRAAIAGDLCRCPTRVEMLPEAMMAHYDLLVVGAGPAGISTAIEARAAGVPSSQIVVLEKGAEHSYAIRRFYPEGKRVDAVYKGLEVPCEGRLCITD